jgi:hypothetical protein
MFLEQFHEVIFQVAIRTTAHLSAVLSAFALNMHLLRKTSLLRKVNQLAFALSLQPRMGHGEW